jgi:DNA-directed RNA polymerase subunit RPC12/RpoP
MKDIKFKCEICGQPLEAPADMTGDVVECPNCKTAIMVSRPSPPTFEGFVPNEPLDPNEKLLHFFGAQDAGAMRKATLNMSDTGHVEIRCHDLVGQDILIADMPPEAVSHILCAELPTAVIQKNERINYTMRGMAWGFGVAMMAFFQTRKETSMKSTALFLLTTAITFPLCTLVGFIWGCVRSKRSLEGSLPGRPALSLLSFRRTVGNPIDFAFDTVQRPALLQSLQERKFSIGKTTLERTTDNLGSKMPVIQQQPSRSQESQNALQASVPKKGSPVFGTAVATIFGLWLIGTLLFHSSQRGMSDLLDLLFVIPLFIGGLLLRRAETRKVGAVFVTIGVLVIANMFVGGWFRAQNIRKTYCATVITNINDAKDQCAMVREMQKGATVFWQDIEPYLKGGRSRCFCPFHGTYDLKPIGESAECSYHRAQTNR